MKLTTHLYLVLRLCEWSYTSTPPYALMVCRATVLLLGLFTSNVHALGQEGESNRRGDLTPHPVPNRQAWQHFYGSMLPRSVAVAYL